MNKAVADKGGIAISGGVNTSLTVSKDARSAERYERRYAIFEAVGRALNEALCDKMISPETFRSFSKAMTDSSALIPICLERHSINAGPLVKHIY
jgi:hypothetical protein